MSDELKIQTSALAEYVCDGNDALEFKLVGVIFDAVHIMAICIYSSS